MCAACLRASVGAVRQCVRAARGGRAWADWGKDCGVCGQRDATTVRATAAISCHRPRRHASSSYLGLGPLLRVGLAAAVLVDHRGAPVAAGDEKIDVVEPVAHLGSLPSLLPVHTIHPARATQASARASDRVKG